MTRLRQLAFGLLAISAAAGAAACSKPGARDIDSRTAFLLNRATSCDHLETLIQDDAIAKVNARADQALADGPDSYFGYPGDGFNGGMGGTGGSGGGPIGGGGTGGGTQGPPPPAGHSETNNQVAGVEEADIVKTDGEHLWLLHGNELEVMRSWPPQSLAVTTSLAIEGSPIEMLVEDGKAVIYSQVSQGGEPVWDEYGYEYVPTTYATKITVVDLDDEAPRVERELYIEGDYRSARGHGATVRTVINGGFKAPTETVPDFDYDWATGSGAHFDSPFGDVTERTDIERWRRAVEDWRAKAIQAIEQAKLGEWLPVVSERVDGRIVEKAPSCTSYYVPAAGSTGDGITSVVSIDLDKPTGFAGASILGSTDEVYANADEMVLAYAEYSWAWPPEPETTTLHRFDLVEDGGVTYVASGAVPGHLHDQFSIDSRNGVVRVSTTENVTDSQEAWTTQNRMMTLRTVGNQLEVIGSTGPLAEGEQIYSTRFVGDTGYVVTFRQVDPLFVVDLADPEQPKVLGELKIPGFSDYMHPLGKSHLLTIGRDIDEDGVGPNRLALQIFDVSNPTDPKLAHKHVFEKDGHSEANHEHKAFTYYADRGLLAFPFYGWDSFDGNVATLEVFSVSAESGFAKVGSIDHSPLMYSEPCEYDWVDACYGYQPELRRGVFIDDFVYSISHGGVMVHSTSDLSTAVATVPLPTPSWH